MNPMLACDAPDVLTLPQYFVSIKHDGVRAAIRGGKALSRTLKPIGNLHIREALASLPESLDIEVITYSSGILDSFQVTSGKVRRSSGKPEFKALIFDTMDAGQLRLRDRYKQLERLELPSFACVVQQNLLSPSQIDWFYNKALAQGAEGIIIRDPDSPYKHGRSTQREQYLMRRKPTLTSEATCVKLIEALENRNPQKVTERGNLKRSTHQENMMPKGTLGALEVEHPTFGVFRLSGFTDVLAAKLWANPPLGELIEFEYKSLTDGGKPRHPIFKGIRYDL